MPQRYRFTRWLSICRARWLGPLRRCPPLHGGEDYECSSPQHEERAFHKPLVESLFFTPHRALNAAKKAPATADCHTASINGKLVEVEAEAGSTQVGATDGKMEIHFLKTSRKEMQRLVSLKWYIVEPEQATCHCDEQANR